LGIGRRDGLRCRARIIATLQTTYLNTLLSLDIKDTAGEKHEGEGEERGERIHPQSPDCTGNRGHRANSPLARCTSAPAPASTLHPPPAPPQPPGLAPLVLLAAAAAPPPPRWWGRRRRKQGIEPVGQELALNHSLILKITRHECSLSTSLGQARGWSYLIRHCLVRLPPSPQCDNAT
jgi:hypothetical protein